MFRHTFCVNFLINNRIGNSTKFPFLFHQTVARISAAKAGIHHHTFRIMGPAFDHHSTTERCPHQRWMAVGIIELHVVPRQCFVDGQDLHGNSIVLLQKGFRLFVGPVFRNGRHIIKCGQVAFQRSRGLQRSSAHASLIFRCFPNFQWLGIV